MMNTGNGAQKGYRDARKDRGPKYVLLGSGECYKPLHGGAVQGGVFI